MTFTKKIALIICPAPQIATNIFHGGCLGCLTQHVKGVKNCKKCQYHKPNWNLPDLSIK